MNERRQSRVSHRPILAVDDDTDELFAIARLLLRADIEIPVHTFPGAEAAIGHLERTIRAFDPPLVSFVACQMPAVGGLGVLQWIRSRRELDRMPVVILAAEPAIQEIALSVELGAQGYFRKGLSPSQIACITDFAIGCDARRTAMPVIDCQGNLACQI